MPTNAYSSRVYKVFGFFENLIFFTQRIYSNFYLAPFYYVARASVLQILTKGEGLCKLKMMGIHLMGWFPFGKSIYLQFRKLPHISVSVRIALRRCSRCRDVTFVSWLVMGSVSLIVGYLKNIWIM